MDKIYFRLTLGVLMIVIHFVFIFNLSSNTV